MIELKHLKTLRALRDAGSLVAASERLYMTQSALSHQLNEIEQRLGYRFFIRKSQPIRFTEQGEILLQLADSVLEQVDTAIARCKGAVSRSLKIAVDCHSCIQWLIPALKTFEQIQPDAHIEFESGAVFNPHPIVLRGELDLLLTSDRLLAQDLDYQPLFDYEVRLILSPEHALADKQRIAPGDLSEQTLLTYPVARRRLDVWQHFLSAAGVVPKTKTVDNTSLLIQMVAAGMGVAALPHWASSTFEQQGLITTKPLGDGLWRRLYTTVRRGSEPSPLAQAFSRTLRQQALASLRFVKPA